MNTCEGCEDCEIPGIRWPTATNSDHSHPWVERCDTCERFESDDAAAAEVARVTRRVVEWGQPVGVSGEQPYVV